MHTCVPGNSFLSPLVGVDVLVEQGLPGLVVTQPFGEERMVPVGGALLCCPAHNAPAGW